MITSIKDDSAGGDSNNDGNASTPARADWDIIGISTAGSRVGDYTSIR